jgi:internalin A
MSALALKLIKENIAKHKRGEDATYLDLGRTGMTEVPEEIGECVWLETLIFSNGWIEWTERGWIEKKSQNNGNYNKLKNLTMHLGDLVNLKIFHMRGWYDRWVVSDLSPLTLLKQLQILSCAGTNVFDLSPLISLNNLEVLDLGGCEVTDLSPLSSLTQLKALDFAETRVRDLIPLTNLFQLRDLCFHSSSITNIKPLSSFTDLQRLNCSHTQVRDLSPIEQLVNLKYLDCSSTQIFDLGPLTNLIQLEAIDCSATRSSDLTPLTSLVKLKTLDCSATNIKSLQPLASLKQLKKINCSSTKINSLSPLINLKKLKHLNCFYTGVKSLEPLNSLFELEYLKFSYTEVSDLSSLAALSKLLYIDCNKTNVNDIYPLLPLIKKGRILGLKNKENDINLQNCPLVHPPIEVVQQGKEAIIDYFALREKEGTIELLEAKAVLIGEGMAGKTSLRNRLLGRQLPKGKDRTKGLDVDIQPYQFAIADGKTLQLNLFDFGGQDHYKPLHQFFYSKRSLYILLTRNGDDQNDFDFWLDTAKLHGDGSPLLVVNNLFGDVKCNFQKERWQREYPILKESFEVNLDTKAGMDALKQQIEAYAQLLPHIKQAVPRSWANIREALKTDYPEAPYIDLKQYLDLCKKYEIEERKSALILSQYLHDIGVLLHYQDNETLRKYIILRNDWATEAVYRVLDDKGITEAKGHFTPDDLKRVWCADEYVDMRDALLELMREFRLCYPKPGGQAFIAPSLLPTEVPPYTWEADSDDRHMRLEYTFMPRVLLTQFIVEEHEKIEDGRLCVWRSGAVFFKNQARVEVRQSGKNVLEFRAQGEGKVELLTILNDTLDSLHQQTPGIEVEILIPCICEQCRVLEKPYMFKKSRLDNRVKNNRTYDECQVSFIEVMILDLLGRVLLIRENLAKIKHKPNLDMSAKKAFFSYSKHDIAHLKDFQKFLKPLERQGLIEFWDDRLILPGEEWNEDIKEALAQSDIIFLLVTADFTATDYIWDIEIKEAMSRHEAKTARVIPIKVSSCDWAGMPFAKLQGIPRKDQIIDLAPNKAAVWTEVVSEIKAILSV